MNIYGSFALVFKVFDRSSVISCPSDVFVRSGERRRGTGAMGVELLCEGMLMYATLDFRGVF